MNWRIRECDWCRKRMKMEQATVALIMGGGYRFCSRKCYHRMMAHIEKTIEEVRAFER